MKHVRLDPSIRFPVITPEMVKMYDRESFYNLERGDLVHYRTPDSDVTFVVSEVFPADMENFDKGLRIVHLTFLKPQKKEETVFEEEYATAKWRTGRSVGRTIYAMRGAEATDTDALIGMMDTPALARAAVQAHNKIHYPDEL